MHGTVPSRAESIAYRAVNGDRDLEGELLGIKVKSPEDRQEAVTRLCRIHEIEPEFLLRVIRATATRKAFEARNEKQESKVLFETAKSLAGLEARELDPNRLCDLRDLAVEGLTSSVVLYLTLNMRGQRRLAQTMAYTSSAEDIDIFTQRIPWAGEEARRIACQMCYGNGTIEQLGEHTMHLIEFAVTHKGSNEGILEFKTFGEPKKIGITEEDLVRNNGCIHLKPEKLREITHAHIYEIVHGLSGQRALETMFSGLTEFIGRNACEIAIGLRLYRPEFQFHESTSGTGQAQESGVKSRGVNHVESRCD